MQTFDVGRSLKVQGYLNNQTMDDDTLNFLDNFKFKELLSPEEKYDVQKKIERYKTLEQENKQSPSADISSEMQELAQDVIYSTGTSITSININDYKTTDDLDNLMLNANLRSKNDLYVYPDYSDYSASSNYVKCNIVSHDYDGAYGISANARMVVTKSGKIITSKNSLYMK